MTALLPSAHDIHTITLSFSSHQIPTMMMSLTHICHKFSKTFLYMMRCCDKTYTRVITIVFIWWELKNCIDTVKDYVCVEVLYFCYVLRVFKSCDFWERNMDCKTIIATYTLHSNCIHMLITKHKSKIAKLVTGGQTYKITSFTDKQNLYQKYGTSILIRKVVYQYMSHKVI